MTGSSPVSTTSPFERLSQSANQVLRRGILSATQAPPVARLVRTHGMRLGAARFVAGETIDEAVPVLRGLNAQGLRTNTTLLGEAIHDRAQVDTVVHAYLALLDRIAAERLQTNVAIKLTHLGLDLSETLARECAQQIVAHAAELSSFVRIDMEESSRVDATLRIYRHLRDDGYDNVGTVLQSMLYRTPDDLDALRPMQPNLRIVKGAYLEPASVAHPKKVDVDRAYVALVERALTSIPFTAIATHDERIIQHVLDFTAHHGIGNERYEFQMLYGIRSQRQVELANAGYRVLVATPYGTDWYPYLMRRLAERPANLLFLAKNVRP